MQAVSFTLGCKIMADLAAGVNRRWAALDSTQRVEFLTVDNCCSVRYQLQDAFEDGDIAIPWILLDFWHFQQCYAKSILSKIKNPAYNDVVAAVTDAILTRRSIPRTRTVTGLPALYHPQEEQTRRLHAMWKRFDKMGNVWSEGSVQVHQAALRHVEQGCLNRPAGLEHLPSDSSCNESAHKHWNDLQRAVASGVALILPLSFDFMHRRNLRIIFDRQLFSDEGKHAFVKATGGLYHLLLVDQAVRLRALSFPAHPPPPPFPDVKSGESFGILPAEYL